MAESFTILDALRESITSTSLGKGKDFTAFPMPAELADTVLRIRTVPDVAELRRMLNSTTCLSGNLKLLNYNLPSNVGEPLAEFNIDFPTGPDNPDKFSIALHRKIAGTSYDTLFKQCMEKARSDFPHDDDNALRIKAHKARVAILAEEIPQESYDNLIKSIAVTTARGFKFDFKGDNILIDLDSDKKTMGIMDLALPGTWQQEVDSPETLLEQFLTGSVYTPFCIGDNYRYRGTVRSSATRIQASKSDIDETFKKNCRIIVDRFVQALENTHTPMTEYKRGCLPAWILEDYCGYKDCYVHPLQGDTAEIIDRMQRTGDFIAEPGGTVFRHGATTENMHAFPFSATTHQLRVLLNEQQNTRSKTCSSQ